MMRRLLLDRSGASAAEFALALPLLMILTLGTIDAGRYFWNLSQAKKAAQYGVRIATVTSPIEGQLVNESFIGKVVGGVTLTQGDVVPAGALGKIQCTSSAGTATCTTLSGAALSTTSPNNDAFAAIVDRMQAMYPLIEEDNVVIRYEGSGLGYAGDPHGADVAPLVTVELQNVVFSPVTTFLLTDLTLPSVASSLTAEDLASHNAAWGSQSN